MLDLWNQRGLLKARADAVVRSLGETCRKVHVSAEVGAGRHTLVQLLRERLAAAVVEVPPLDDLDAPLHTLVQLATDADTLSEVEDQIALDPARVARHCGEALVRQDRTLVLLLPLPTHGGARESAAISHERIDAILRALAGIDSLRLVVIAAPEVLEGHLEMVRFDERYELVAPKIGGGSIKADLAPPELRAAATKVAQWMQRADWASTPFEARLQVGLVALGERPDALAARLPGLADRLVWHLKAMPALAIAVRRLLVARQPLPADQVARVSGAEPRWISLLTTCIGYGDDLIRVPDLTRHVLLEALGAGDSDLEDAHASLADYHQSLDGARSLRGLSRSQALNWLEKVHHLSLGGEATAGRWAEQEPAGREQLWERARFLSRDRGRYAEAAELYRRCIGRYGEDPYSMHYLAYNLERARGDLTEIRRSYELAAHAELSNPWWQQRWIRFLIAHGTLEEARAAWRRAIQSIDPNGQRMRRSPWLALNLHALPSGAQPSTIGA